MDKIENWDSWLVKFAREVAGLEFEWGTTDCASLVRRGLRVMFAKDIWKNHVGIWTTRRGALTISHRIDDYQKTLELTGAHEVGYHFGTSSDVALAAESDEHGMVQMSLLLPTRKALTSLPEIGVVIVDKLDLTPGTRFWRYGG